MFTVVGKFSKDGVRKSDGAPFSIREVSIIYDHKDPYGNFPSEGSFAERVPCTDEIYSELSVGDVFEVYGCLPGTKKISFVKR